MVRAQNLRGSRNGDRKQSVLAHNRAGSFRKIRNDHIGYPQIVDTDCSCRDIDDRIHRPDFMKMNTLDRFSVYFAFRLSHNTEDFKRKRQRPFAQITGSEDPLNICQIAAVMVTVPMVVMIMIMASVLMLVMIMVIMSIMAVIMAAVIKMGMILMIVLMAVTPMMIMIRLRSIPR